MSNSTRCGHDKARGCLKPPPPLPPAGQLARRFIKDPELLRFIDLECYIWSTVSADLTPLINSGMVFCDRHFGGINYPKGGVGLMAEQLAEGERGGQKCGGCKPITLLV